MKQIFYVAIGLMIFSCNKKMENNLPPSPSTQGTIQYKVNGGVIIMDNINVAEGDKAICAKQLRGVGLSRTRYVINGQKKPNNFFAITLVSDSLQETSYHYDSASLNHNFGVYTFDIDVYGQESSLYFATDKFDVNITSYKNAKISGTFTATLSLVTGSFSDYATSGSIHITEGIFDNIPVSY